MPKFPANQGLMHTAALYGGGQRWQVVSPFIATTALIVADASKELCDWFEATVVPLYRAILAADCEIIGQSCEEMHTGNALPYRVNYATGTFPGLVAGRSYSQQVSILTAWYSTMQISEGPKTHTGKTFWGPPPESVCDQQNLDPTYVSTDLANLVDAVVNGFMGGSGTQYYRGLAKKPNGTDDVYQVDFRTIRQTVFTQRRRLTPTF